MRRFLYIIFIITFFSLNQVSASSFLGSFFDTDTIHASICEGNTYNQYGFSESQTGTYIHNDTTYLGDDSITVLNLSVNPTYFDTIIADICDGQTYNQYGFSENRTGIYIHNDTTFLGCDSIIVLGLTVRNNYYSTTYDTLCRGDEYEGFIVDTAGVYIKNLNTIFGCDSVLTYNLFVNPTYYDTIKAEIYKGEIYNKFGFKETETGVYAQELKTYLGCDSIIYLDLQVDYIMIPNVITPNGDGKNDVFEIHNLVKQDAFPENELIIYNRQGKLVYSMKNIQAEKDFWAPANNIASGTYFYRFTGKRPRKEVDLIGTIEVLR